MLHHSGHPKNAVDLAMWCHLIPIIAGFLTSGLLGFVGPLVILYSSRQPSAFVDAHAKESLNFQLSVLIYAVALSVIGMIIVLVTFGLGIFLFIPLVIGLAVAVLVFEILATIAATKGELYQYPLTIRFIK